MDVKFAKEDVVAVSGVKELFRRASVPNEKRGPLQRKLIIMQRYSDVLCVRSYPLVRRIQPRRQGNPRTFFDAREVTELLYPFVFCGFQKGCNSPRLRLHVRFSS